MLTQLPQVWKDQNVDEKWSDVKSPLKQSHAASKWMEKLSKATDEAVAFATNPPV